MVNLICSRVQSHPQEGCVAYFHDTEQITLILMAQFTREKSLRWDYKPRSPVCIHIQKDHICTLKILQPTSEFGGLWKHWNNPACTKSVRVFIMLDTVRKKKMQRKIKRRSCLTWWQIPTDDPSGAERREPWQRCHRHCRVTLLAQLPLHLHLFHILVGNNNNDVLYYVLFLQIGANSPLQTKE